MAYGRARRPWKIRKTENIMDRKTTTTLRAKKNNSLTPAQARAFQKEIYAYYDTQGRDLPWRKKLNPYRVLVSEIMLQQTQVERVIVKFQEFLDRFPDFHSLAKAPLPKLLRIWSGHGLQPSGPCTQGACAKGRS